MTNKDLEQAWTQGFIYKCAQMGIDPQALVANMPTPQVDPAKLTPMPIDRRMLEPPPLAGPIPRAPVAPRPVIPQSALALKK